MRFIPLLIFIMSLTTNASSQNCQIRKLTSYADTFNVIQNYTFHLLYNAKNNLKSKLTSLYNGYLSTNGMDTCYLFLIPNSESEAASDGDFLSLFVHKASIDSQKNVRWIEVVRLYQERDFYMLTLTTNRTINGKKSVIKKLNYKVKCQNNAKYFYFQRKRFGRKLINNQIKG